MLKITVTAVAATALMASAAFAAEVEGVVTSYDPTTRIITLDTGESFVVPDEAAGQPIEPGAEVRIVYDEGSTDATEVTVTP